MLYLLEIPHIPFGYRESKCSKSILVDVLVWWQNAQSSEANGLVCGPIEPCVQTVLEEARPNTSLIRTNGVRKGPAQYPVWGQTNIRGQPAKEWIKLPSEERWSMLVRNWAVSEDDGHLGTFVRGIWWTY